MALVQVNVYFVDRTLVIKIETYISSSLYVRWKVFNAVILSLYAIYVSVAINDIDL